MVLSLSVLSEPVGSIKHWLRPTNSEPLPSGWLVCDGSTVVDPGSSWNGTAVPDLRGFFPRGQSSITNANFGSATTYFAGGGAVESGGTDSNNLSHQHSEGSHNHGINGDSANHTHTVQGNTLNGSTGPGIDQINTIGGVQFVYAGVNGQHNHNASVSMPFHVTDSGSAFHNHGGGTNFGGGGGTSFNLGSTENRPVFRGLIYIIKVK